jgi:ferric-dicitrate binding protein FerR (iron transport regulator)
VRKDPRTRFARLLDRSRPAARYSARAALLFAIAIASAPLTAAIGRAQTVAGSIAALTGTAHVQRGSATSLVTLNMPVQVGDRLNTDADSSIAIVLTDATRLELGESSALAIDQHLLNPGGGRASTKVSLFGGFVRSIVNLTAGGSPNFEVHTPNAVAAARGTDFDTGFAEGATRPGYAGCNRFSDVAVLEGTVGVSQAATPNVGEVTVTAGYETTIPCGLAPLAPGPLGLTGAATTSGHGGGGGIGVIAPVPVGAPPPSCPVCPGMSGM